MLRRSRSSTAPSDPKGSWLPLRGAILVSLTLASAAVGLALFCGSKQATHEKSVRVPDSAPSLSADQCTEELRRHPRLNREKRVLRCGYVPDERTRKSLHPVELSVVRVGCRSSVDKSHPDSNEACPKPPLLVLPGGPGDAMISDLPERLEGWLERAGDRGLIYADPRGTGTSRPNLTCARSIDRVEDLERCYDKWRQEIDLDRFNTRTFVEDLWAILRELEVSEVAVYGVSYGTRVATELARAHPDAVQVLVLDSPLPASVDVLSALGKNAQEGLEGILRACREEEVCPPEWDLSMLADLVRRLDEESEGNALSGTTFLSKLTSLLYSPEVLRHVPYFVKSAQQGDFEILRELSEALSGSQFAWGMHLSVQCAERYRLTNERRMETEDGTVLSSFRAALSARDYLEYCEIWEVEAASDPEPEQPISTPALVLSGEFDGITPPEYANLATRDFLDFRVVSLPRLGHGAGLSACGSRWIRARLDQPDASLAALHVECAPPKEKFFRSTRPAPSDREMMVAQLLYSL